MKTTSTLDVHLQYPACDHIKSCRAHDQIELPLLLSGLDALWSDLSYRCFLRVHEVHVGLGEELIEPILE